MPSKRTMFLGDINRLLRDERLSPNRRTILAILKLWMKLDGSDKDFIKGVIDRQFGSGARIKWTDPEDAEAVKETFTNLDKEATDKIRNLFDEALKERGPDAAV